MIIPGTMTRKSEHRDNQNTSLEESKFMKLNPNLELGYPDSPKVVLARCSLAPSVPSTVVGRPRPSWRCAPDR